MASPGWCAVRALAAHVRYVADLSRAMLTQDERHRGSEAGQIRVFPLACRARGAVVRFGEPLELLRARGRHVCAEP